MDLALLEDFLELARELNFSRAAAKRNLTQPAFSRRIRALETALQTDLVVRTTRQVSLTAAGKAFQPRAEMIVRMLVDARREALEVAGQAQRNLTIAATHALSYTFVPRWLMQVAGPADVGMLNMISDTHRQCVRLMESGDSSFFICHKGPVGPSVLPERHYLCKSVGKDRLVPLCAPSADGRPKWELGKEATEAPLIAYAPASGLNAILEAFWSSFGRPDVAPAMSSVLAAANREMAKAGQGVAYLPQSLAEPDMAAGTLVRAGSGKHDIPLDIVIYRPRSRLSPHCEAFWQKVVNGSVDD
ncbi:LysR family transcriptional regulator [Roseibium suaedae]|uniref:DNA-binding transcriptional regulator, LysR family n=1 Tax=Roseibium suaedae TaxID=735517 RepID=A0A1M7NTK0_9HYPH|nr:LysR family transcriptional regulator [Roseibium suaedae]SHN07355.1 DNA-binding transcriptional regulator, LysR family [Roseibium suaedae]